MTCLNRKMTTQNHCAAHGFTLVEILIVVLILGILAALVVPKFSNASALANETSLRNDLRHLRTQVMVYRAQHGVSPGYPGGNPSVAPTFDVLVAQLTRYTSEQGEVSAMATSLYRYGPYIQNFPKNPVNHSNQVKFIAAEASLPFAPSGDQGWIYQPATATIMANVDGLDGSGNRYFDY